jgi:hypothetical protein
MRAGYGCQNGTLRKSCDIDIDCHEQLLGLHGTGYVRGKEVEIHGLSKFDHNWDRWKPTATNRYAKRGHQFCI